MTCRATARTLLPVDQLRRIYENLPADYWWLLLVMVVMLPAIPLGMRAHYHLRTWYWHRRASRDGGILPEERYAAAPGSPPPEVAWRAGVLNLLGWAALTAAPAVIIAFDLPGWLNLALIVLVFLLGIAIMAWRKLNDPVPAPDGEGSPPNELPIEAVHGFFAAVAAIALLLFLLWLF